MHLEQPEQGATGGVATPGSTLAERFEVQGPLGEGAVGTVVCAFDRVRRHPVALKYLRRVHPDGLYRFKQEFRLLSEVVHPHVVMVYELVADQGQWAVVMELVEGARSFLDFVRPHEHLIRPAAAAYVDSGADSSGYSGSSKRNSEDVTRTSAESPDSPRTGTETSTSSTSVSSPGLHSLRRRALASAELNADRIEAALSQLVDGLDLVRQRGLLHRDIKPSNVLVDRSGRIVICDFGLVMAAGIGEQGVFGTPSYMSPEQAEGAQLATGGQARCRQRPAQQVLERTAQKLQG